MFIRALIAAAGLAATSATAQTYVMVADSTNDRVSLFNFNDGTLFNAAFIVNQAGFTFDFPKDVIQVGNEIWVSDQTADSIFRFNLQGIYLSTITGGLDNIRGMEFVGGTVYVSNAGTANGAPGTNTVVKFNTAGANQGFFVGPASPFDIYPLSATEILVSGSSNNPDVTRHDLAGTLLSTWHNGTISFAEQITKRSNSEFLIAGFTDGNIRRYDSAGVELGILFAASGARGVIELGDGNIMWTNSAGIHVRNLATGGDAVVVATSGAQFVNRLALAPNCYPDCDGVGGLTANDFACFLTAYSNGASYADCDGVGGLTANDFACFLNAYSGGCS
jgi:hypothetical protein